jgi:glycosyltransferase involved in cell wall biosynthesis
MSKKRILVLPSDRTGVGKFRSVQPHTYLQQQYPDEFHIDIMYDISIDDLNFFKNYDIVSFHRSLNTNYDKSREVIGQLKQMGIKTVCDIDDYWMPGMEHPAHAMVVERKFDKIIVNNLREAEWVTTTTDIFANEIRKTVNKNVHVIPNGIDPEEPQFKEKTIPSDKVRFGWLGGSSHLHDLMILDGTFDKISDLKDKYRLYICGFDTRGTVTEIDKATGTQKQRPILPEETVWAKYEKIFTSNYKFVTEKQKEFLMKWKQEEYMDEPDPFYTRVWTAPVTS